MAKCITDVMSERTNASVQAQDTTLLNSFTEAIDKASMSIYDMSNKLNQTNCTKIVFDWCKDKMGINVYAASAMLANIQKSVSSFNTFDLMLDIPDLNFNDRFCKLLSTWIAWIQGIIDIATKAAFVVFAKIDAAVAKLEASMNAFTDAVLDCILDILDSLKANINLSADISVGASIDIKWPQLENVMYDCPCFCKAVAHMTGCTEDDEGNDISENPEMVLACLKSKLPGLSFSFGGAVSISGSMTDLVYDSLMKLYTSIKKAIKFTFDMIMKPLRALIKAYADLLTQKFDVTAFIKALGNMECFFVYTIEYKNNKQFYGMSIIDMINTFKGWTRCFNNFCPSLARDIAQKIKEINESLRLDDKFWKGALMSDLYTMCIATKLGYESFTDTELRAIYQDNPKNQFDSILSVLEATNVNDACKQHKRKKKVNKIAERTPVQEAIMFRTGPDRENEVNTGDKKITENEEKLCIRMSKNLIEQTVSPYFTEKFYQLLRLLADYEMTDDTVAELTKILDASSKKKYPVNFNATFKPFKSGSSARQPLDIYPSDVEVTYSLTNDYNEAEIAKILGEYA